MLHTTSSIPYEEQKLWKDSVINQRENKHALSKVSTLDLA